MLYGIEIMVIFKGIDMWILYLCLFLYGWLNIIGYEKFK